MSNAYNGRYEANACSRAHANTRAHTEKQRTCERICARVRVSVYVCAKYACPGGDVSAQTEPGDNGY